MAYYRRRKKRKNSGYQDLLLLPALILFIFLYLNGEKIFQKAKMLKNISPSIVIIGLFVLFLLLYSLKRIPVWIKNNKYRHSGISEIDRMKGTEFEEFLKVYFKDLGYKVYPHTGGAGDRGADLILKDPQGRKVVVQAKRYSGKVPFEAVQQVHTARSLFQADRAILISNYYLTKQAEQTARQLNIEVWNRQKLIEQMYQYRRKSS